MFSSSETSPSIDEVTKIIENKKKTLQTTGNNRKVWMSIPGDVLALYIDDAGNMMFNDYLLQEMTQVTNLSITEGKLWKILDKLSDKSRVNKEKHNNLSKLNEKNVLKMFDIIIE